MQSLEKKLMDGLRRLNRSLSILQKIGDVVGQKGKTINEIIDRTGVKIDITDDGAVSVCGTDKEMIAKAIDMIKIITTDFEQGQIFEGTVVSIKEFGAFIEFAPGKEGMVHISKIAKWEDQPCRGCSYTWRQGKGCMSWKGQDGKDKFLNERCKRRGLI